MRAAEDAIIVDTTNLTPEQVLEQILSLDFFQAIRESK